MPAFFKTADKLAVGEVIATGGSSQSNDEQAAKFPFFGAPVAIGKLKCAIDGLFRRSMQFALS